MRPAGRKALRAIAVIALAAIALAIVAFLLIGRSTSGARWLVDQVAAALPGTFEAGRVEGSLARGLVLHDLVWQHDGTTVTVDRLALSARLPGPLRRRLTVHDLLARGVHVALPPARDEPAEPFTLPELSLPVTVELPAARIEDLAWARPGEVEQRVDTIELSAALAGTRIDLERLAVRAPGLAVDTVGTIETRAQAPALDLAVDLARLDTAAVSADLPPLGASGTLALEGPPERLAVRAELALVPAGAPAWQVTLDGVRDGARWNIEHLAARGEDGAEVDAQGWLETGEVVRFDADVDWRHLELGPAGDVSETGGADPNRWISDRGQLQASGTLDDYRLEGEALLAMIDGEGKRRDTGALTLAAHGGRDALEVERLGGALLGGTVRASGTVAWDRSADGAITVRAEVSGRGLDPGTVRPEWPGDLDLDATVAATIPSAESAGASPRVSVTAARLRGQLRDRPLEAVADLELGAGDGEGEGTAGAAAVVIRSASGSWGGARASASGRLDERWDLDWSLVVPDLADLLPGAAGRLRAEGQLAGSRQAPRVTLQAEGEGLRTGEASLGALAAGGTIDLAPGGAIDLSVDGRGLDTSALSASTFALEARGRRGDHRVEIDAEGTAPMPGDAAGVPTAWRIEMALAGGVAALEPLTWNGRVVSLAADAGSTFGTWTLEEAAALRVAGRTVELETLCLGGAEGRACVDGTLAGDAWTVEAALNGLPLPLLAPFLPAELTVDGTLDGTARARGDRSGLASADLALLPQAGTIAYFDAGANGEGRQIEVPYRDGEIVIEIRDGAIDSRTRLDLGELGRIVAEIALPPASEDDDPYLHGDIELELTDLALLQAFSDQIADAAGSLVADLEISGTRAAPRLAGSAALRGGRAELPELGLTLRDIDLDARGDGHEVQLSGTVSSGGGTLALDGTVALDRGAIRLGVRGDGFHVIDTPDLALVASPDLTVEADARTLTVRGRLGIPALRLPFADPGAAAAAPSEPLDADLEVTAVAGAAGWSDWRQARLDGRAVLEVPDLAFLPDAVPDIARARGRLEAELRLDGTLGAPAITGQGRLRDGAAEIPDLGIALSEIELDADEAGDGRIVLRGKARSGEGTLTLEGEADVVAGTASLTLRGERATVLDRPEFRLVATPDLRLELADRLLDVRGAVAVDAASIDLDKGQSQVPVSDDVRIVGGGRDGDGAGGIEMRSDLRIALGDAVRFQGFGLDLKATGNIRLVEAPGRPQQITGEIRTTEGKYKIYGQTLTIDSGRMSYLGGSLTNPILDVRASRKTRDETIAGVRLRGPLRALEVDVLTEPPTSPSEALAYLILGRPLATASTAEGDFLTEALASAGLRQGNAVTSTLATKLRLDQIAFENTGASYQDARLLLGKNISPRLFVAYGVGLFRPINTLLIRYKLHKRYLLQAEAGAETEVDLLYDFERGAAREPVRPPEPPADADADADADANTSAGDSPEPPPPAAGGNG